MTAPTVDTPADDERITRLRDFVDRFGNDPSFSVSITDVAFLLSALLAARREVERMQSALRAIVQMGEVNANDSDDLRETVAIARAALLAPREAMGDAILRDAAKSLLMLLDEWAWTAHHTVQSPGIKATVAQGDMVRRRNELWAALAATPEEK